MLTYFCGDHIKEAYMYEYLRDFMKYLKEQSEMKEELEHPAVYWIVDLKRNITLWSGLAFRSSFILAISTLKEYYATELKQSSKL